ncbi:MAG: glycoside hydrolase domain-containing protein [Phycisphaeraceae bacterium]
MFAQTGGDSDSPVVGWAAPRIETPPTIDGEIGEEEWKYAARLNALQARLAGVSAREVTWFTTWNPDHLYIAMRSPMRPGERPIQNLRRTGRDINVAFDDSYEVWLDVDSRSPEGLPVFFQYLANIAGAKLDTMHIPTAGNQRMSWTADWLVVNRLTDDNVWEMEMEIPRENLGVLEPFEAGREISLLLARNFKRPWEQNSISGTGTFTASDTYSRVTLVEPGPAIKLMSVADHEDQQFAFEAGLANPLDEPASLQYRVWTGEQTLAEGTLDAEPDRVTDPKQLIEPLGLEPETQYGIEVVDAASGRLVLAWSSERNFGRQPVEPTLEDRGDVVRLSLAFNPIGNYLSVDGDLIQYDARDEIESFDVEVRDASGDVVNSKPLQMDELAYVSDTLQLPDLPPGEYTTRLRGYDASGEAVIDETRDFEKKDHTEFEWWQTDRGNWETLLKPWTAVEWDASASTIGVLDRTYHLGPLGLPAQVTSRGEDVLASPVRLELTTADGETARSDQQSTGDWQTRTKKDFRVVASTGSGLGELQLSSTITAEYDGMVKYELTLDPTQPVDVESLRLVLPYRSDLARLYHAAGRGIRFGFDFDFLPGHGNVEDTRGVFWGSKKVDGQGMAVGSFIPYMWLGGTHAGIAWFADSDEGWTPSDETSAIQMSKSDAGSVDLVLNLISEPTTLDAPRTIVFALQATPVKPMPPSWRDEEWSTGSTFKDFQQVRPKGGHLIWTNIPFTLDPDASRDMVQQNRQANSNLFAGRTPVDRLYAVPYLEWKHISPRFAPEVGYFADQWKTEIGEGLWFSPSLRDYLVYQLSNWIDEADIDGIYLDNVRPTIGDNLLAGQGYELPDGRVQPTFQMFETRELFLRFRALFHEKGKHGKFVLHMTNNFIAPWIGPADILLDGEHHSVFADSGATFMDYWSLPRIQLANPQRWGNITTFLQLHKGRWDPATLQKANRAFVGMLGSHDILVGANSNGSFAPYFWATWAFATQDEGVDFIPYWDVNDPIAGDDGDTTLASAWTHPDGRVLVIVANRGEEPTTVDLQLDAEALGLSSQAAAEVRDAELLVPESVHGRGRPSEEAQLYLAGLEPIEAAGPGRVSVPVAGEDYRLLWFGPVPEDAFDVGGGD